MAQRSRCRYRWQQDDWSVAWDTTTATNGSHTLTAVATDRAGLTATSDPVASTVQNSTANPNVMYVSDIAWSHRIYGPPHTDISLTVNVNRDSNANGSADASDAAVANAAVTVRLIRDADENGLFTSTDPSWMLQGTTDSAGQVTFGQTLKFTNGGFFQATVTSLTNPGDTWDENLDADNPSTYNTATGTATALGDTARHGMPMRSRSWLRGTRRCRRLWPST